MDADQITDIESMRVWAIQQEAKVLPALKQQSETNRETKETLKELREELKCADRRIQRWVGMGLVFVPIAVALLNYVMRKL